MKHLGLSYPVQKGKFYFETVDDTLSLKKIEILNVLNTIPGERRFQPDFGSKLWHYVFDPNIKKFQDEILYAIRTDIKKWVNSIEIENISIQTPSSGENVAGENNFMVLVKVYFVDLNSKTKDVVEFLVKRNI